MTDGFELRFQNRGKFVNRESGSQWRALDEWASRHSSSLYELLAPFERNGRSIRRILFGEWLFAKHSVAYNRLPDYFVAFDIAEDGRLLSVAARNALLADSSFAVVQNVVPRGIYTLQQLIEIVETHRTAYSSDNEPIEGVYLKVDPEPLEDGEAGTDQPSDNSQQHSAQSSNDNNDNDDDSNEQSVQFNVERAKLVRKEFIQQIVTHWSKQELVKNTIAWD